MCSDYFTALHIWLSAVIRQIAECLENEAVLFQFSRNPQFLTTGQFRIM